MPYLYINFLFDLLMVGCGEQVAVFNGLVAAAGAASVQEEMRHSKIPVEEQL